MRLSTIEEKKNDLLSDLTPESINVDVINEMLDDFEEQRLSKQ